MHSNLPKRAEITLTEPKWVQMNLNENKWGQMSLKKPKLTQILIILVPVIRVSVGYDSC